jgi:hypothetical protein
MLDWYRHRDLLSFVDETIIGEDSPIADTVARVYSELSRHPGDAVR